MRFYNERGMRARLTGASVAVTLALLAGFAPAAGAQDPLQTPTASPSPTPSPTATPTPTPTPTPEEQAEAERDERDRKAEGVRRVYRDFERDGFIDDCDHTARALKRARRSIEDSYAEEHPDFRDALTAALERHRAGECEEQQVAPEDEESPGDTGGGTGDTGGSGGGTSPGTLDTTPPPPPPPPAAPPAPEQGTLPDFGNDNPTAPPGDSGGDDVAPLPDEGAIPEGTPSPEATPVPTQAPPVEPKLIVSQSSADPNMFVPGTMLAVALIGLLIAALTGLLGQRSERLAGVTQAWREAAWRTSGTWSDFTDWLRAGR
jgi:hypothetical protein